MIKNGRQSSIWQCRRGSSAVEFALIIVPLFSFVFGTFEFGRLLWTRDVVKQAAIAGARCMGLVQLPCSTAGAGGTYTGVYDATNSQTYVVSQVTGFSVPLTSSGVTVTRAATCASPTGSNNSSQVTVAISFKTAVPGLISALSTSNLLSVSACFPNQT